MSGAQDHGVHLSIAQRSAVAADGLHHLLVEREAPLDDRGQVRAGHALQVNMRIGGRDRLLIGPGGHRGGRGQQSDPAGVAGHYGQHGRGGDHPDHVEVTSAGPDMALDRIQRRRAGGVTGDDQELGALLQQVLCDLDGKSPQLLGRSLAIREARRVAQVHIVLARQRNEQLVQHGQPADSGVEDRDRVIGTRIHARGC